MKGISSPPTIIPSRAMIKTGTFTGNGVDDRNLDIGVDLAAKSNVWVIVRTNDVESECFHRIEYAQGDGSMTFYTTGLVANCIQAFTATGFQLGTNPGVNSNGGGYNYLAFWEEP